MAIVTGGGHGVGYGIALALSGAGAKLVICGRTADTLATVRHEIESRGGLAALDVVCDITDPTTLPAWTPRQAGSAASTS